MFRRNEGILCLYRISLSALIIYDFTLTLVIMSELHHLRVYLTRLFFYEYYVL